MIIKLFNMFFGKKMTKWKDIEYFNPDWKERIKNMAEFIEPKECVMDLGCGQMWLREFLPDNCKYIGVDYVARDDYTLICDFNLYQFPEENSDVMFISGCLEYVENYEWFINQVSSKCKKCILSYCITDNFPNILERKRRAWVNHFSRDNIITLFKKNNFKMINELKTLNNIFVFEK